MKANKFSRYKTLYSEWLTKEVNFVKNFKYFIATSLFLILAAAIVLVFVNFNYSFDYAGGYNFVVKFNTQITSEEESDFKAEIKDILKDNKISKFEINLQGEANENAFSVNVFKLSGYSNNETVTLLEEVSDKIEQKIKDISEIEYLSISEPVLVHSSLTSNFIWQSILAFAIVIAAFALYVFIRFDLAIMFSGFVGLVHDSLLMLALLAILRVQVSSIMFLFIAITLTYSAYTNQINFARIREGFEKETNEKKTNAQVVENVLKGSLPRLVVTTAAIIVTAVAVMVVGKPAAVEFGLTSIVLAATVAYSSLFVIPSVWALIYNREKDKRLQRKLKNKNKKTNVEQDNIVV